MKSIVLFCISIGVLATFSNAQDCSAVVLGSDLEACDATSLNGHVFTANIPDGAWTNSGDIQLVPDMNVHNSNFPITADELHIESATGTGINTLIYTVPEDGSCPSRSDTLLITIAPPQVETNIDYNECDDFATLTASFFPTGGLTWVQESGNPLTFNPNDATISFANLEPDNYTFTATIACPESAETADEQVNFEIFESPEGAEAGDNQRVCEADAPFNLSATVVGAGTNNSVGTWTYTNGPDDGGVIDNQNDAATLLANLSAGMHTFTWTVEADEACGTNEDEMTLTVDAAPSDFVGYSAAICGDSYLIDLGDYNATNGESGEWSVSFGTGDFFPIDNPKAQAFGIGEGLNTYIFTTGVPGSICSTDTAIVNITVLGQGEPAEIMGEDTISLCITEDVTLTAVDPSAYGTGTWSIEGVISGSGDHLNTLNGLDLGVGLTQIIWTVTYNTGCVPTSDTIWISVLPDTQVPDAGEDIAVCETEEAVPLSANNLSPSLGFWSTSGDGQFDDPQSPDAQYFPGLTDLGFKGDNRNEVVLTWTSSSDQCPSLADELTLSIDLAPNSDAGEDDHICILDQPYTFRALEPLIGAGTWTGPVGVTFSDETSPDAQADDMQAGTNTFRWTVRNGVCADSASVVEIEVDAPPSAAVLPFDELTVCLFEDFNMPATTPVSGEGLWTTLSGTFNATIDDPNDPNSSVTKDEPFNAFTLIAKWEVCSGVCPCSADTIEINTSDITTPMVSLLVDSERICEGEEITFTAQQQNGGDEPQFTFFTAINDSILQGPGSENSYTIIPDSSVSVYVTMESSSGCDIGDPFVSSNSIEVILDMNPTAANAGSDQVLCVDSTLLDADTPLIGTGHWELISGSASLLDVQDANSAIKDLLVGQTVLLDWVVNNGVCPEERDEVLITRNPSVTVPNAGEDGQICEDSFFEIAANSPQQDEYGEWSTSGDGIFDDHNEPGTAYTPGMQDIIDGTVSLIWSISDGSCTGNTDEVVLTVDAMPTEAEAGEDMTVCAGPVELRGNNPEVGIGTWTNVDPTVEIDSPNLFNTTVDNLPVGVLSTFSWEIANGLCPPSSDEVTIMSSGEIVFPIISVSTPVCEDDTIHLTVDPSTRPNIAMGESGLWRTAGTGSFGISGVLTSSELEEYYLIQGADLTNGSIKFFYTLSNEDREGCEPKTDSLKVEVRLRPNVANAGEDQLLCAETATLNASEPESGYTGYWILVDGGGVISDSLNPQTEVNGLTIAASPLTLMWSVIDTGFICEAISDTVLITQVNDGSCTTSTDETVSTSVTELFPNPAVGAFVIKGAEGFDYRIVDVYGHVKGRGLVKSNEYRYDVDGLSKGLYLIDFSNGSVQFTRKLVIE